MRLGVVFFQRSGSIFLLYPSTDMEYTSEKAIERF